jgi:peptidyl-prolyl cis-trans isomerase D
MLKVFRNKNVAKMVLWAILILILPAFVLWGTGSLGGSKSKGPSYAGEIGGKRVSFEKLARAVTGVKCQVILNYYAQPPALERIMSDKAMMGKMAWDRLLMQNEAGKLGLKAGDAEVVEFIKSHPIFSRGGRFDDRIYQYVLQRVPIDPRSFEEIVRESLTIQKLNDAVARDVAVTDAEVLDSYHRENDKLRLSYVIFAADDFAEKTGVDEAAIREYYDGHKNEFTLPEAPSTPEDAPAVEQIAKFEDVKDNIKGFLVAVKSRDLAGRKASEEYEKIKELMSKEKLPFEEAVAGLGLKKSETPLFARAEYLDGIGEASVLTDAAVKLRPGEVSAPVDTRKGPVIFKVAEVRKADADGLVKDKEEYSKRVLAMKKLSALGNWLRSLEAKEGNRVLIDFEDYEKYFR